MEEQCSREVADSVSLHYYPCRRKAKVERDGKPYCTIHDPEYIKAKREKWNVEWEEKAKCWERSRARSDALDAATKGLTTEELQRLNPNLCKAAPDMYEALRTIVEAHANKEPARAWRIADTLAKQVLAKASGVNNGTL